MRGCTCTFHDVQLMVHTVTPVSRDIPTRVLQTQSVPCVYFAAADTRPFLVRVHIEQSQKTSVSLCYLLFSSSKL